MDTEGKNIVLIGMSGAGKSTLGVLLAKALGKSFIDTDIAIQQRERRKLQAIINAEGIERFLEIEESVLSGLRVRSCVIATGGSAVYSEKAMAALKSSGVIVYLRLPFSELKRRLYNIKTRGIVMSPGSTLDEVFAQRLPLYEKYADLVIDCSGRDAEDCVSLIIDSLETL